MKIIAITLFVLFISNVLLAQDAPVLKDFVTDGCTMFIDGPPSNPTLWRHCCFEHDLRYWFGGTSQNLDFADLQLKSCVKKVAGNFWATVIYEGVRAGQFSPIKNKYSWSWGWTPKRKKNTELSSSEIQYVIERLNGIELDPQYKEEFIRKYLESGF